MQQWLWTHVLNLSLGKFQSVFYSSFHKPMANTEIQTQVERDIKNNW